MDHSIAATTLCLLTDHPTCIAFAVFSLAAYVLFFGEACPPNGECVPMIRVFFSNEAHGLAAEETQEALATAHRARPHDRSPAPITTTRTAASRCRHRFARGIGGLLPNSLLGVSVQRDGSLDVVLRSMEDEARVQAEKQGQPSMTFNYQSLLSVLWIGSIYETLLLLSARGLAADTEEFRSLAHDLGLLRIPLEKHEVAGDKKLEQPLQTVRVPPKNDSTDIYEYSRDDPRRAHIMPWV